MAKHNSLMAWYIGLMASGASGSYEIDHEPTAEDIEDFKSCFLSDLLGGYLQIDEEHYEEEN